MGELNSKQGSALDQADEAAEEGKGFEEASEAMRKAFPQTVGSYDEPPRKTPEELIQKLLDEQMRHAFFAHKICPDCMGTRFLEGPHGGLSVKITCARCGARFNVCEEMGSIERI